MNLENLSQLKNSWLKKSFDEPHIFNAYRLVFNIRAENASKMHYFNLIIKDICLGNVIVFFSKYALFIFLALGCLKQFETNSDPKCFSLSLFHQHSNGVGAHNFNKLPLLQAYNKKHNFDGICPSETFHNSFLKIMIDA